MHNANRWAAAAMVTLAGCAGVPDFSAQRVMHQVYDGVSDDLLTAGLGKTALAVATPPAVRDAKNPTVAELRRRTIHANYRALADMSAGGGYGVLYGPNVDLAGKDTLGEGRIAGDEFLAYVPGTENVAVMVQVPTRFDPKNPCIVTGTSSGSRGVYGAIGTSGEWGLKRGCAVAYTDKGTGTGFHDLDTDSVILITGERASAVQAGSESSFTAALSADERTRFVREFPHRVAIKHAHSQANPEKDWGRHTLSAIDFAFWVLNNRIKDQRAGAFTPENTIVIASSISNGGYAALAAAEQDTRGLIDGVAVSEPNVSLSPDPRVRIRQGANDAPAHSRALLDYYTLINIYQPCASLTDANAAAPLNTVPQPLREARCASLAAKGLLKSATVKEQAAEAQRLLNAAGILPESNLLHPSHSAFNVPLLTATYAMSYGRFSITDNLCGYSFAATAATGNNAGNPVAAAGLEFSFATSNGIAPTAGINVVNNLSRGGAKEDRISVSASNGQRDMNLDGALCLRALVTGTDAVSASPLSGHMAAHSQRVRSGMEETRMSANLRGKPAVIVNGRADAILPPNHASRAYAALNAQVEPGSKLRYYEVTNAHHLDVLNGIAGFDFRYVPLNVYLTQALNMMWAHLKNGAPLAPSQVIRTTARGQKDGKTVPLTGANVPPISQSIGGPNALIGFGLDGVLRIPE